MAENYIDKIEVDGVERPIRDTSIVPSDTAPKAPGTAVVGKEKAYARGDHVHPKEVSDAERAAWNGKAEGKHASQHGKNGADPITPTAIGAATVDHNHYGRIIEPTSIELFPGTSAGHGGYIDFHYNSNSADYTSRIVEGPSGYVTLNGMGIMTRANIAAVYNVQAQFTNGIFEYSNSVIKAGTICFAQFRGGLVTSSFRDTALSTSSEAGKVKIVAKNGETFKTTVNVLMINL